MLRLVVASLFVTATAFAQAPGEVEPVAPAPAPAPVVYCGGDVHESVMANRWAVGLSVGSLGLAPKDQPNDKTQFGVGELSVRFRATLHLELELAVGGGRQQLQNGQQGDLQVNTGMLDLRYRFAPESKWNWWLMAGLGSLSVTQHDSTQDQQKAAEKPLGALGIGIERRFHHFAIDAELRAIGTGEKHQDPQAQPATGAAMMTTTQPPPPAMTQPAQKLSGGVFTIGASYYF